MVDDFVVKYINKEDTLYLERTIQAHYPMKSDWKGERYIGIDLNWDYEKRTLCTSMKGYVKKALIQFQHETTKQHYFAPSKYIPPKYRSNQQMPKLDTSDPISKDQKLFIQQGGGIASTSWEAIVKRNPIPKRPKVIYLLFENSFCCSKSKI